MILLLDFEKAFDSVPVDHMLYRLKSCGVNGYFLRIIHAFLTTRTLALKVNNYVGPRRRAGKFGLPQGSVLSPLLFIIYIADLLNFKSLPSDLSGCVIYFKYADDGSILVSAKSLIDCHAKLQKICNYRVKLVYSLLLE